mgnify:FL=1
MGPIDMFVHLAGFAAPALALGLALPLASRLLFPQRRIVTAFWWQASVVAAAGLAAMSAGLWWFGRDGKMATYGLLLVAAAGAQWVLAGHWRR